MADDIVDFDTGLFEEPADFRPPTPQGTVQYLEREPEHVQPGTPAQLELHLPAKHSLWGHVLWNAGVVLARYIDSHKELCASDARFLELGAAASVPSLVAAINGAKCVITDWPDPGLMNSITKTVLANAADQYDAGRVKVVGFQWGKDMDDVMLALDDSGEKFDVVLLADLIFNHTEHVNLLKACYHAVKPETGSVFVYFTSHVVKWAHKDMKFFELAQEEPFKFEVEKIGEVRATAMFPDDIGDIDVRKTVNCYRLWLPKRL